MIKYQDLKYRIKILNTPIDNLPFYAIAKTAEKAPKTREKK